MTGSSVDGVLVRWGERLFYPGNRVVRPPPTTRLDTMTRRKATVIRRRIVATVAHRAPQVMVKVGHRREAFNIMLSMPRGTEAQIVLRAARDFARAELTGHRYVMVLHEHQANPHVHVSVRAESSRGERLNPRKCDLHRWRETFAEKLRDHGIEAEATRQATRGAYRTSEALWRVKAREDGRLRGGAIGTKAGDRYRGSRIGAVEAWANIVMALEGSDEPKDLKLAAEIRQFVRESPFFREQMRQRQRDTTTRDRERQEP